MPDAITLTEVSKVFGTIPAVDNVSLTIPQGMVYGFLGPNGAGKTTTVRLINGLLKPDHGSITVLGKDVRTDAQTIRQWCGVQTDTAVYDALSAYDNLAIWGRLYDVPQPVLSDRIKALLTQFHLQPRAHDRVSTFSKGMRQKVLIARALIHDPRILFLDEPTSGLDPEATEELLQYLETYVAGKKCTVFLCSHRLEEVERLAHEVGIIHKGKLITAGDINRLTANIWPETTFRIRLLDTSVEPNDFMAIDPRITNSVRAKEVFLVGVTEDKAIARVVEWLVHRRHEVLEVTKVHHSLQDVYLHLIPKEEQ